MNKYTDEWVIKAESDFRVAQREAEADPPEPDVACFHAAQCAEKYIKAFLPDERIDRDARLVALFDRCQSLEPDFAPLRAAFTRLDRYGPASLYPGAQTNAAEAREALAAMQRVRDFVRQKLGLPAA